ncbi:MAG: hypothetical protein JWP13_730, partial [Candidatus Saccharibacteria bacterium]|nr:hypothetical protein [Candidatus Saccharibacteria bacterium]
LGAVLPRLGVEALQASALHPGLTIETVVHFYANLLRTAGEMFEASHCRLSPERLQKLGDLGIATGALYHEADPFFPASQAYAEIGDAVDHFAFGKLGGHLAPMTYPYSVAQDLRAIESSFPAEL